MKLTPAEIDAEQRGLTPTICVDLDNTILEYDGYDGKTDVDKIPFGKPLKNAQYVLRDLKERGWRIVIFTHRKGKEKIAKALKEREIPFDEIIEKPFAHIYLDDRALRFTGDWAQTYVEIHEFKPWRIGFK